MADYIPTSAEFDRYNNVTDWSRTTVADGNWLQKNTIGPLKQRDIELLELIRQHKGNVYSAGDYINIDENNVISVSGLSGTESWMRFSIDNGSEDFAEEAENDYYIGKENSAFGRAKIIGDDNMALNSTIIGDNNVGISTSELIKKDGTLAHYETVGIYPAQNFIVGDGNVATKTRNAFIFGNDNYTETTEADLQLDCDPNDPNVKGQDNDGFTLAFGLCNSAIRNYDMAIGKGVLASGGENIVIGAPTETHYFLYTDAIKYNVGSIGYKNLNIRSNINGISNKAFESCLYTNEVPVDRIDNNILEYSDLTVSGDPIATSIRRNILINANTISFKNDNNETILLHNNEFKYVTKMNFTNYSNTTITAEGNEFVKMSYCDINVNTINNNKFYDVANNTSEYCNISANQVIGNNISKMGTLNVSAYSFNHNTFDHFLGYDDVSIITNNVCDFNIIKNIKETVASDITLSAYDINGNIFTNTDLPEKIYAGTNFSFNILYNINQYAQKRTWHIKKTMENNIFLNSNYHSYDENQIILENPEYVSNNIVFHSTLSAASAEGRDDTITQNVLINSTLTANYNGTKTSENKGLTVNNFLFDSELTSEPSLSSFVVTGEGSPYSHQIDNATLGHNIMFGATAKNIAGSFIVSDGQTDNNPAVSYSTRIVSFGDETIYGSNDSTYLGNDNTAHFNNNCFIAGECNKLCIETLPADWYEGKTLEYENSFSRCFILGISNELLLDQPLCPENYPDGLINAPARNFLIGSNNKIHVSGRDVTQNILIGDSNIMGYNKNYAQQWSVNYTQFADRNLMFGSNNKLSDEENDNIILGNNNIVAANTYGSDHPIFSTNIAIGGFNSAFDGSNQINIGYRNETNGHFAGTIGRYLESHGNQLIVGQLNDYPSTPPATLLASAWDTNSNSPVDVENSGVLFAVGNGRVNAFEYMHEYYTDVDENHNPTGKITEEDINPNNSQYVTWSNAMIVSADGTVSAKTYKADPTSPLGKLFDFLATAVGDGDLHWNGTTWSWSTT